MTRFSLVRQMAGALWLCVAFGAWAQPAGNAAPAAEASAPRVKFTTNYGEFVVQVYPDKAPKTAENFLQYVRDKHYEGREALARGGPRNTVGTLAMARTNAPHSATAQFFINVVDNGFLDPSPQQWGYTTFGKVVSGMEVVNKIRGIPTGFGGPFSSDVPLKPAIIQSAVLL